MNINTELQSLIVEILKKNNGYISSKVIFDELQGYDEKTINGNVVLMEKDGKLKIKAGVDTKYYQLNIK